MSIKPLPGDVVAQIKSSVVITSLNNVITGLVTNSLDAEATKINVTVDYSRGNCSIEDNGVGIPPSEFREDGGLGQLHYTSKYPPRPDTHGKHGVFLASVASLSLLSITSHNQNFHSHNSLSIHNSKVLARHTPCLPEQRLLTVTHGTRVTVRDLFGSMPVRVKHRAVQAEKSSFTRDWDRLALDLVALLIPWPGAVSISVSFVDSASRQTLIFQVGPEGRKWVNDTCQLLHRASLCESPGVSNWVPIGASCPTLSVSGYVCREPVATKRAQFISLGIEPLPNEYRSNVLYEEVNKVFADSSFGLVEGESDEDEIPKKNKTDGLTQKELKARKGIDRWPMFFLKITPAASSLDVDVILDDRQPNLAIITDLLKAMFYEFLKRNHCRPKKVVLFAKATSRSHKQLDNSRRPEELAFAASSQKRQKTKGSILAPAGESAGSHFKVSDNMRDPPFAIWSKIKSGKSLHTFEGPTASRSRTESASPGSTQGSRHSTPVYMKDPSRALIPAEPFRPSLFDANGKLTRKPFDDLDPQDLTSWRFTEEPDPALRPIEEPTASSGPLPQYDTDECSGQVNKRVTKLNSRTGFVNAPKRLTVSRSESEDKPKEASRGVQERSRDTRATTPWVADLINRWKNPVFELTEPPIPKLPDVVETLGLETRPTGHHCHHEYVAFNTGTHYETTAMGLQGRLMKENLKKAQLIAQVDKKFILARLPFGRVKTDAGDGSVPSDPRSVLVLIDQHAADERCRVEQLMAGYFEPFTDNNRVQVWKAATEGLPQVVQFELSGQEKDLLCQFQPYFAYWGIYYRVESSTLGNNEKKTTRDNKAKITVRSLPPAILERCRTDTRLLVELIRKEAWRLKDEDKLAQPPIPRPVRPDVLEDGVPGWVSLFHACPPGIIELVNSRSCRSAIMFNDPLTIDQCSHLLDRLTRCSFPFQCAHGRPSMVPLVDLGDGMIELGNPSTRSLIDDGGERFGQAFRKWKEGKR